MSVLMRAQIEQSARRSLRRLGVGRPSPQQLSAIARPDTTTAGIARSAIEGRGPATLVNHSERTYAFAALLGARDKISWDAELLYVAAMLHDVGLTGDFPGDKPFQEVSADFARSLTGEAGWTVPRTELTARAIEMHMELGRATRERPEVALLHLGAAADVTGMRLEDISPATVAEVVAEYPRLGFKDFFVERVGTEARRHPTSMTAFLCRWGQFQWRIKHAPFDQ